MLYQGGNKPIQLEFDEPVADTLALSVTMFDASGKMVLRCDKSKLTIDGNKIYVPVSQEQTANMALGKAKIFVKWKSVDGYVDFADEAVVDVVQRDDRVVIL